MERQRISCSQIVPSFFDSALLCEPCRLLDGCQPQHSHVAALLQHLPLSSHLAVLRDHTEPLGAIFTPVADLNLWQNALMLALATAKETTYIIMEEESVVLPGREGL